MADRNGFRMDCFNGPENRCLNRLNRASRYRVEPIEEEPRVLLAWQDKYVCYSILRNLTNYEKVLKAELLEFNE